MDSSGSGHVGREAACRRAAAYCVALFLFSGRTRHGRRQPKDKSSLGSDKSIWPHQSAARHFFARGSQHRRHCFPARHAGRSRIRSEFRLFLSVGGGLFSHPCFARRRRIDHRLATKGRRLSLGGRGLWTALGVSRHLAAVD